MLCLLLQPLLPNTTTAKTTTAGEAAAAEAAAAAAASAAASTCRRTAGSAAHVPLTFPLKPPLRDANWCRHDRSSRFVGFRL